MADEEKIVEILMAVKSDIGELKGTSDSIHRRIDEFVTNCHDKHTDLENEVSKNTNFRHYAKGIVAIIVALGGIIVYFVEGIWSRIHLMGE